MYVSFSEIISQIADEGWGRKYESKEEAKKSLVANEQSLTAFATLELIKRLNAIGRAAGNDTDRSRNRELKIPKNAKRFPNKSIGERLFCGNLIEGFAEFVIIAKDSEHHCMVVLLNNFDLQWPPAAAIAQEDFFDSMIDAVKNAAEEDVDYYGKRAEFSKKALDAAIKGEDVSEFIGGYDPSDDCDDE